MFELGVGPGPSDPKIFLTKRKIDRMMIAEDRFNFLLALQEFVAKSFQILTNVGVY